MEYWPSGQLECHFWAGSFLRLYAVYTYSIGRKSRTRVYGKSSACNGINGSRMSRTASSLVFFEVSGIN